jgi:hypothetical protein
MDALRRTVHPVTAPAPRNLGSRFAADSLGPREIPSLAATESAIRTLSGLSNFRLTAGQLVSIVNSRVVTAPLIIEYGLASKLTLGVVVPLVETRSTVYSQLNPRAGSPMSGRTGLRAPPRSRRTRR